jgi:hypothetical protein
VPVSSFGLVTFGVIRVARPTWRTPPPSVTGRFPWRRLAVTMLAPLSMIVGTWATLPGVHAIELEHIMRGNVGSQFSVIALGVAPFHGGPTSALANAITVMLSTAVVLDLLADARAHRQKLAPVGVLHQIQYAGVVERVLADAGIPCHIHASHLRTSLRSTGHSHPRSCWCPPSTPRWRSPRSMACSAGRPANHPSRR